MTVQYRPGTYCDVAVWIHGQLLQVTADGLMVRCYLDDTLIWTRTAAENLLFCRGAVQGEQMLTVHQSQSGRALLVNDKHLRDMGPTFGVQPVGIDAHDAYIVRSGQSYDRIGLISQPYPSGAPGSSQGLSDVQPDGTLWWADLHRTTERYGTLFHYPNERFYGPSLAVLVGQVDPPGIAAAVNGKVTRVIDGDAYEPHVAVSPNGRVAICARTPKGAAYVATTIQELS